MKTEEVLRRFDTVAAVSKITGVARSTLIAAIGRGEIQPFPLASGAKVVAVSAVRHWQEQERKPGPRPKGE